MTASSMPLKLSVGRGRLPVACRQTVGPTGEASQRIAGRQHGTHGTLEE